MVAEKQNSNGKTETYDYTKIKCLNIQNIRKIFEKNIYNKYDLKEREVDIPTGLKKPNIYDKKN